MSRNEKENENGNENEKDQLIISQTTNSAPTSVEPEKPTSSEENDLKEFVDIFTSKMTLSTQREEIIQETLRAVLKKIQRSVYVRKYGAIGLLEAHKEMKDVFQRFFHLSDTDQIAEIITKKSSIVFYDIRVHQRRLQAVPVVDDARIKELKEKFDTLKPTFVMKNEEPYLHIKASHARKIFQCDIGRVIDFPVKTYHQGGFKHFLVFIPLLASGADASPISWCTENEDPSEYWLYQGSLWFVSFVTPILVLLLFSETYFYNASYKKELKEIKLNQEKERKERARRIERDEKKRKEEKKRKIKNLEKKKEKLEQADEQSKKTLQQELDDEIKKLESDEENRKKEEEKIEKKKREEEYKTMEKREKEKKNSNLFGRIFYSLCFFIFFCVIWNNAAFLLFNFTQMTPKNCKWMYSTILMSFLCLLLYLLFPVLRSVISIFKSCCKPDARPATLQNKENVVEMQEDIGNVK